MFINQFLMTVFFRLFNFGIVIGLAIYAIKKYALPAVSLLMAKEEAEKEYLLSQQSLLENKYSELNDQVECDQALCEDLKIKLNEWKLVSEQVYKKHEKKCDEICNDLRQKRATKRLLIEQARLEELVVHRIMDELQPALIEHFKKNDCGQEYLDTVIQHIHERKL